MTISLYYSTDNYIEIELASVGEITLNGVNSAFSQIQAMDGWWGVFTPYSAYDITLGTCLNYIDAVSPHPSTFNLMVSPTELAGVILTNYSINGYRRMGFGRYNQELSVYVDALTGTQRDSEIYLASAVVNGETVFGFLGIDTRDTGSIDPNSPTFAYNEFWSDFLKNYVDTDPGQKGFRPTSARTQKDKPGVGGRGTANKKNPEYRSDTVTQPGRPNESQASAVKSGFLKSYRMAQGELDKICSALYSDTLLDVIKSSFVNPLDFIVSLMVFPTNPDVSATENLRFGKWIAAAAAGVINNLGVDITGSRLSSEFKTINFGTVQIPENWGNFLDYSQTSIELYLPFIGSVNIDVAECMGGSINVQYTIDFFTGMCVANVLCERSFPLPDGKFIPNRAQHAYQGNCAIQIPLSAADYGSMVGSLINACTQGISNPVAGFAGIASDAIAGGLRPNISSKGNIVANSGFCSVLYPYVRITRPITAEPDSYQEVMGYPSYINTTLGECQDLCICDEIDLKGITGATEDELNKIRQLCKDGIYV